MKNGMPEHRGEIPSWLADNGWVVGAEVGVWEGKFSACILGEPRIRMLYSVDNWMCQPAPEFYTPAYNKAVKALAPYGDRSKIVVQASVPTAREFVGRGELLDFVYIDANHSYEACLSDMEAWWWVVRSGGCLCGHDYGYGGVAQCRQLYVVPMGAGMGSGSTTDKGRHGKCEVQKAVDEFCGDRRLDVMLTRERYPSWMVIKP